jgi:hypothetical protein
MQGISTKSKSQKGVSNQGSEKNKAPAAVRKGDHGLNRGFSKPTIILKKEDLDGVTSSQTGSQRS